ncbi:MAG: pilus assembly protein PilM [Patescibacteria group bacterium]
MKFGFLSKYFPLPQFLKPPHIGISFSDFNIKAISFNKILKNPPLKSIIVPVEKGSIIAGNIVNMEDVVKKLSVVKENFNSPFVFFTIPDELTYVFSTSIMVTSGGNITEGVAFIIEENVPLSLDDTIFDFTPTKIVQSGLEYKASVVVAACVKKEVEKFVEAFHRAGFEPVGCVHESQAIANALIPKKFPGVLCVVHARENRVGIYLVKDNLVYFSTLRSILDEAYNKQFLDEYEKFLEYYAKYDTDKNQPIKTVLICGEFEYAKKAVEAIINSENCIKDVKLSNVWTNVFEIDKHLPDIPYEKSLSFAGPIGAVLSGIT